LNIGILTIGNELLTGTIQDINSSYIARQIKIQGWKISSMLSVGDSEAAIRDALAFLLARSNAVVATGGLGPTADDITTEAIARTFRLPLYTDEEVLKEIRSRFERFRFEWTPNNAKQAMFPEGARTIFNPYGTAWGFALEWEGRLITVIPGVPAEVRMIFPEGVMPLLKELCGTSDHVLTRTIRLFGISESKIDQAVSGIDLDLPGIGIGFYPRFPENQLVISSCNVSLEQAELNLRTAEERITAALSKYIYGYDENTIEKTVAALLTEKGLTLAVAESLTGGLITDRLTDVPGSSLFLDRGIVAYSNRCKTDLLGVPEDVLRSHGAVSAETAVLMAEGVRKLGGTDFGLATTGIAGPSGGSAEKPVGTVFAALAGGGEPVCRRFAFRWDRRRIKEVTAHWSLEMLRRRLTGDE
jgi:nicotinamide-nucleotide amidase